MAPTDWRAANRANWDERVGVHLGTGGYDLASLRAGHGRLNAIEEAELGSVDGLRILHLQCHFGRDSLTLAQRGAEVVGLDFSAPAIAKARELAKELGLEHRARFVEADLYDAAVAISEPATFDLVFVTWGAISWLPDITRWAKIVAHFLKPGGALYLAEGHPVAMVFDDSRRLSDGNPGYFAPYFQREPVVTDDPTDYVDRTVRLKSTWQYNWMHPLGAIVTALLDAGMHLDWLREHDSVTWKMFEHLVEGPDGLYRWPDKAWLPLSFSLSATRT
jgi:SAM-dependent methyltransferase